MAKKYQDPVVTETGKDGTTVEVHPAYGMISASRVQGGGMVLNGSDFRHNGFVMIRVRHSQVNRSLTHDWHFGRDSIVELALSEAQWATFVSSLNMGDGVPCTLERIDGESIPGLPAPKDRKSQFTKEATGQLADAVAMLDAIEDKVNKLKIPVRSRDELLSMVRNSRQEIGCNLEFVGEHFAKHVETTTEHAKIEIGAYLSNALMRAGVGHLGVPISLPGEPATPLIEGSDANPSDS